MTCELNGDEYLIMDNAGFAAIVSLDKKHVEYYMTDCYNSSSWELIDIEALCEMKTYVENFMKEDK